MTNNNKKYIFPIIICFISLVITFFSATIFFNFINEKSTKKLIEKKEQERINEKYYGFGSSSLIYTNNLNENRYVVYGTIYEFDNLKLTSIDIEIYVFTNIINAEDPIFSFNDTINVEQYEIYATGIDDITMVIFPYQYQQTNYYSLNLNLLIIGFTNEDNNVLFNQTIISSLVELPNSIEGTKEPKIFESVSMIDFDFYFLDNLINAEYEKGYENGFNDGTKNCSSSEFSLEWLIEVFRVVERFLDVELLPGFTIKLVILIPLVLSLLYALLKMLR